jgi:hypothetical protein
MTVALSPEVAGENLKRGPFSFQFIDSNGVSGALTQFLIAGALNPGEELDEPEDDPPPPLLAEPGIDVCGTETDFSEKSQENHIRIVVDVAPTRSEGSELLPTLREQVAVPKRPSESPTLGCAVGPEQLPRVSRLSS